MSPTLIIRDEIKQLRVDLESLKGCQVKYFALAITGSGAIFAFAGSLGDYKGFAFLAPLAIILPCWFIFFDKATTITRIVGYQRILEKQLTSSPSGYQYIGYENALAEYRKREGEIWRIVRPILCVPKLDFFKMLILGTRHRYWMINWYTFAVLAVVSCLGSSTLLSGIKPDLSLPFKIHQIIGARALGTLLAWLIVLICCSYTFGLVLSLTRGRSSYEACARKWEIIMADPPIVHTIETATISQRLSRLVNNLVNAAANSMQR
jgi:hypothetical protein